MSVQHELRPGFGVSVGYFRTLVWRRWRRQRHPRRRNDADGDRQPEGDAQGFRSVLHHRADRSAACRTAAQQLCGLYRRQACAVRPERQRDQVGRGLRPRARRACTTAWTLTMNARFGKGGQLSGGVSIGRTVTDNCVVVDSPEAARPDFCRTAPPMGRRDRREVPGRLSAAVDSSDERGLPEQRGHSDHGQLCRAATLRSRRRSAAICRTARSARRPATPTGRLQLIPNNSLFEPRAQQLDLRFTRTFRFGGTRRLRAEPRHLQSVQRGDRAGDEHDLRHVMEGRHADSQRTSASLRGSVRLLGWRGSQVCRYSGLVRVIERGQR